VYVCDDQSSPLDCEHNSDTTTSFSRLYVNAHRETSSGDPDHLRITHDTSCQAINPSHPIASMTADINNLYQAQCNISCSANEVPVITYQVDELNPATTTAASFDDQFNPAITPTNTIIGPFNFPRSLYNTGGVRKKSIGLARLF